MIEGAAPSRVVPFFVGAMVGIFVICAAIFILALAYDDGGFVSRRKRVVDIAP
jgi:hypothetical protein